MSTITLDLIEAGRSPQGGWNRPQLELLGVPWPPVSGWRDEVVGNPIAGSKAVQFVKLRGQGKDCKIRAKARTPKPKAPASIPSGWAMKQRPNLLSKENQAEAHIENVLKTCGLLYTREAPVRHEGKDYFMDFAVETSLGIVCVEVDGSQHMKANGQGSDRKRERAILASGEACVIIRLSWSVALKMGKDIFPLILWSTAWPGSVILRY